MTAASSAPVLSTPNDQLFFGVRASDETSRRDQACLTEEVLKARYEIATTVQTVRKEGWRRVALQFPDEMLVHSAQVAQVLARSLNSLSPAKQDHDEHGETCQSRAEPVKLTILADTSYGSCCVDEIAAEHIDADAIIHYGRACLSPTARLPVLHIYTRADLNHESIIKAFTTAYPDNKSKIILTSDMPYAHHVDALAEQLRAHGYGNVHAAGIVHDPSNLIPNRTIPAEARSDSSKLADWKLFHVAEPPTSLLLTLASKVAEIQIYTPSMKSSAPETATRNLLRRRYGLVTSMSTTATWGILINTLSVKSYMHVVSRIQQQLSSAGKKYYLFVVGKLNPAKIANFADIEGWVVVGCWESSLIDSRDFFRPILTPFELSLALQDDNERIWTGEWRADFANLLNMPNNEPPVSQGNGMEPSEASASEDESLPPEFDLRTGKYLPRSRRLPLSSQLSSNAQNSLDGPAATNALALRVKGDMVSINGVASPAAEYLAERRTWKGLGSDFNVRYEDEQVEGAIIEQGKSGIAGGYTVGESYKT